ncbi:hypothetical protein GCM10010378_31470 [Streptomyces viridochromogenes]
MTPNPPHSRLNSLAGPHEPREAAPSIGDLRASEDRGRHNFWAAAAIQPLDVGVGPYIHAIARVVPEAGARGSHRLCRVPLRGVFTPHIRVHGRIAPGHTEIA